MITFPGGITAEEVEEKDLLTAPPGLYALPNRQSEYHFDAIIGVEKKTNMRLFARVRDADTIALGVDIFIRDDGQQIIKQWCPDVETSPEASSYVD